MLDNINKTLKEQDKFCYNFQMNYEKGNSNKNITGGIFSVMNTLLTFWLVGYNLQQMFTYSNDSVQEYETVTNFDDLGTVDIDRLGGAIPFYSFAYGDDTEYNRTGPEC